MAKPKTAADLLGDLNAPALFPLHIILRRLARRLWLLNAPRPKNTETHLDDAQLVEFQFGQASPFTGDSFSRKVKDTKRKCVPVRDQSGQIQRHPDGTQKEHWIDYPVEVEEATCWYGGLVRVLARRAGVRPQSLTEYTADDLAAIVCDCARSLEATIEAPDDLARTRAEAFPFYPEGWESAYTAANKMRKQREKDAKRNDAKTAT